MAFSYSGGTSGIRINGRDLSEFSCKLQSAYTIGACSVGTDLFQGRNRSSILLLDGGWLSADVTFTGLRQKEEVTVSTQSDIGAGVVCQSTFPRTDCVIRLPRALLNGASQVAVELGDQSWFLTMPFTGNQDLVLDGVNKIFLLGGQNVTAQMDWEDFPYLVPGHNSVAVFINTVGVTRGVEIKYRPTFL